MQCHASCVWRGECSVVLHVCGEVSAVFHVCGEVSAVLHVCGEVSAVSCFMCVDRPDQHMIIISYFGVQSRFPIRI